MRSGGKQRRGARLLPHALIAAAASFGLLMAGAGHATPVAAHAAITITNDGDFATCGCVTGGTGSATDPYRIGPWAIPAPSGGTSGWAVKVDNTGGGVTKRFVVTGIAAAYKNPNEDDPTIWLIHVTNPTSVSDVSGNDIGIGVELDASANVAMDGLSFNKTNGTGVAIRDSSFVTVDNSKLKDDGDEQPDGDGIYAVDSHDIKVGMSTTCPKSGSCLDLTYDEGFGVYLRDTHGVVLNKINASANDTGGFVLDGSYDVTLSNTTASGTGDICNSANGTRLNSGYFSDLQGGVHLINGSHDNAIVNDTFSANVGFSIGSGGNGFYADACTNSNVPFAPVEAPMGAGNTFTNICFKNTNIAGLEPNCAKS